MRIMIWKQFKSFSLMFDEDIEVLISSAWLRVLKLL